MTTLHRRDLEIDSRPPDRVNREETHLTRREGGTWCFLFHSYALAVNLKLPCQVLCSYCFACFLPRRPEYVSINLLLDIPSLANYPHGVARVIFDSRVENLTD